MVLVYRVDVRALSAVHRDSIVALVNDCFDEPISTLDYSYGVVYQDHSCVLGATLVEVVPADGKDTPEYHHIRRMCVRKDRRDGGIGTEMLTVMKEHLGAAHAYTSLCHANSRLADLKRFMRTNDFASCAGTADRGAGMSFAP